MPTTMETDPQLTVSRQTMINGQWEYGDWHPVEEEAMLYLTHAQLDEVAERHSLPTWYEQEEEEYPF